MLIHPLALDKHLGYPSRSSFVVKKKKEEIGYGVYSKKIIERGCLVARFTGQIVHEVVQHSLQINQTTHILDMHFAGYLLHSCNPNAILDMSDFTIWALQDIEKGEALTIDYATTEDVLYRQFRCLCKSPNCRHWISGRKEKISEEGLMYIDGIAGVTGNFKVLKTA